jgi:hypothetical protein
MKRLLTFIALIFATPIYAGFYIQHALTYLSHQESIDSDAKTMSGLSNIALIGARFGKNEQWVIGQSIHHWSLSNKDDPSDRSASILELGPRLQLFLNRDLNFYVSLAYHLFAKGSRTVDGENQDVSGSSILGSIGYQLRLSRSTYLGFSVNYHNFSLSEVTVDNQKEDSSDSVTRLFPSIELSLRF